jgi:hypothetical protein
VVDPAITAYLAARDEHVQACYASATADRLNADANARKRARAEMNIALARRRTAFGAVPGAAGWPFTNDSAGGGHYAWDPVEPSEAEDLFVFFPLLVDEYNGDDTAAQIAWHLGQRPAGYPEVARG